MVNNNGSVLFPNDLFNYLIENNSEFKEFINSGKTTLIYLYSCDAAVDYRGTSLANELSKMHSNLFVVGANGSVIFNGKSLLGHVISSEMVGVSNTAGNGAFIMYHQGKEVHRLEKNYMK